MGMTTEDLAEVVRINRPESWRRNFIAAHGARCHYCNRGGSLHIGPDDRPWHVDHMNPLARGGADEDDNLTLACKRCNLAKGVQPYNTFAAFARAAFWVPADWRASEGELDHLMNLYTSTCDKDAVDPAWRENCADNTLDYVDADGASRVLLKFDPYSREDENILSFIAHARRLLPSLISEIRMLRADEKQAAVDEAAA